ncbi:MAG: SDR family NAD(P)-dependent oxidoreductase [Ruegeria sp.]
MNGQRALLIGASGGIGQAVAAELGARGVSLVPRSRSADGLDLTDEAGVERAMLALEGPFDLIFVATGALEIGEARPEKSLRALSGAALMHQFALNALGPALILRHAPRLLPRDRRAVFAALSARVGSIGDNRLGGWYSYRASKAALNQIVHTGAIELARTHPQSICVAMHPGTVATPFTRRYVAAGKATSPELAATRLLNTIEGLGAGNSGGFYDYAGREIVW